MILCVAPVFNENFCHQSELEGCSLTSWSVEGMKQASVKNIKNTQIWKHISMSKISESNLQDNY